MTGPAASAEFLMSLTNADGYRPYAPGSPPVKVIVPHGRPETTFDIKYFTRERRRVHEAAVNTGPRKEYALDPRAAECAAVGGAGGIPAQGVRSSLQEWHAGGMRRVSLLDDTNNGYT
jgi:hypothetical protein